ncbi:4Fe-4S dicluster domain-containing protein [Candidatus Contubernalis alkaliaceticus]|uniref:4Fe-4S dicluster domain-containing protein n=1 Tax=Candidatus Contubernalis alkaliaceticus TaxID=338645 RepID=UPI001F4C3BDB|nr:4Fe-4S dicluster domain-containing protein [Candidatus Contubernalis alkalaceticus]UNC90833.1 4Fe-4S dicluster domain-containing protein [Candidatus Contubernalis alkalaceticus]
MAKVKLIDVSKCIGCRGCQSACKNWNQLPAVETKFTGTYENPPDLSLETWCRIKFNEYDEDSVKWYFSKYQCMHCSDPACKTICPVNAISITSLGTVNVDYDTCIGCGACQSACPFDVPRIDTKMMKCTQCFDRVSNGQIPACAKTCPTGAVTFGEKEDKITEAEERVNTLKDMGFSNAQVYGKDELGGLGVIYALADAPEKYGLPADPQVSLSTYFWNVALAPVKTLAALGLTIGFMGEFMKKKASGKNEENIS